MRGPAIFANLHTNSWTTLTTLRKDCSCVFTLGGLTSASKTVFFQSVLSLPSLSMCLKDSTSCLRIYFFSLSDGPTTLRRESVFATSWMCDLIILEKMVTSSKMSKLVFNWYPKRRISSIRWNDNRTYRLRLEWRSPEQVCFLMTCECRFRNIFCDHDSLPIPGVALRCCDHSSVF